MSISVAVPVGEKTADDLKEILIKKIKKLKVGPYNSNERVDFGPVISQEAKEKIIRIIQNGQNEGAELIVDGSKKNVVG